MSPTTPNAVAKRRAAEIRAQAAEPTTLPPLLVAVLENYRPLGLPEEKWASIRTVHHQVLNRSHLVGRSSFIGRCGNLAHYLAWRLDRGLSIDIADAMVPAAIDNYYRLTRAQRAAASANDVRSRLHSLAATANPALAAVTQPKVLGHQRIKPPYTDREAAILRRVANNQRRPHVRRRMNLLIGLCAGAGLDSVDLRLLTGGSVIDHDDQGIEVIVSGPRPRTVWVRRTHEDCVRTGMDGIGSSDLVLGGTPSRRNIATSAMSGAELYGDVPDLHPSRLRATWLAWLCTRPVPLAVILEAAGLKSARTIEDIIAQLPPVGDATGHLRDGGEAR